MSKNQKWALTFALACYLFTVAYWVSERTAQNILDVLEKRETIRVDTVWVPIIPTSARQPIIDRLP